MRIDGISLLHFTWSGLPRPMPARSEVTCRSASVMARPDHSVEAHFCLHDAIDPPLPSCSWWINDPATVPSTSHNPSQLGSRDSMLCRETVASPARPLVRGNDPRRSSPLPGERICSHRVPHAAAQVDPRRICLLRRRVLRLLHSKQPPMQRDTHFGFDPLQWKIRPDLSSERGEYWTNTFSFAKRKWSATSPSLLSASLKRGCL